MTQPASIIFFALLSLLTACSGGVIGTGGGGGGSNEGSTVTPSANIQGQSYIKTPAGSIISVYERGQSNAPRCTLALAASPDFHNELEQSPPTTRDDVGAQSELDLISRDTIPHDQAAQTFSIPDTCVESDQLYTVVLTPAVDTSNLADSNTGVHPARTVISGQQMMDLEWGISDLTEAMVQLIDVMAENGLPDSELISTIDQLSPLLVTADVNVDGAINMADLLEWNPAENLDLIANDTVFMARSSHPSDGDAGMEFDDVESVRIVETASARLIRLSDKLIALVRDVDSTTSEIVLMELDAGLQLTELNRLKSPFITDLALKDQQLILALGDDGFQILDLSIPTQVQTVSSVGQKTDHIVLNTNQLFTATVAERETRVRLYDTGSMTNPELLSEIKLPGSSFVSAMAVIDSNHVVVASVDWATHQSILYRIESTAETLTVSNTRIVPDLSVMDLIGEETSVLFAAVQPLYFSEGTPESGLYRWTWDNNDLTLLHRSSANTIDIDVNNQRLISYESGTLVYLSSDNFAVQNNLTVTRPDNVDNWASDLLLVDDGTLLAIPGTGLLVIPHTGNEIDAGN